MLGLVPHAGSRRMHGRRDSAATHCYPRGHAVGPGGRCRPDAGARSRATLLRRGPVNDVREDRIGPTRIVVIEGQSKGLQVRLGTVAVTIRRRSTVNHPGSMVDGMSLDIVDDYLSSVHCRLVPRGQDWLIEDLTSTNGSYLGGARINQATPVPVGVPIRVGITLLELQ